MYESEGHIVSEAQLEVDLDTYTRNLPRTRENERFKANQLKKKSTFLTSIFVYQCRFTKERLSAEELLLAMLIFQMPMCNIMWLFHFSESQGSVLTLFLFTVLIATICTPLLMLYAFLGMYTRRGYITFWNCMPIFKGLGYAFGIHEMIDDVKNVNDFCSTGIQMMIFSLTNHLPWKDCDFKYPIGATCRPFHSKEPIPNGSDPIAFASSTYYRHIIVDVFPAHGAGERGSLLGEYNLERTFYVLVPCLMLSILMIHGVSRYMKWFRKLLLISIAYIGLVFLFTMLYSLNFPHAQVLYRGLKPIGEMKFWTNTAIIAMARNGPGSVMYIASLAPKEVTPAVLAMQVALVKIVVYFLILAQQANIKRILLGIYNYPAEKYMYAQGGRDLIFAAMYDVLSFLPACRIFIIFYYFSVLVISFSSTYFVMVAFLQSILQENPSLQRHRSRMSFCGGAIMFAGSCLFLTQGTATSLGHAWFFLGVFLMRPLLLCVVTMLVAFVYTTNTIEGDYEFMYREVPVSFWSSFWKLSPVVLLFLFILKCVTLGEGKAQKSKLGKVLKPYVLLMDVLSVTPVFFVIFKFYWRKWRKKPVPASFIRPTGEWGPPTAAMRRTRNNYNPEKDIKCRREELRCEHICLTSDHKRFEHENKQQKMQFDLMYDCMKNDKSYYEQWDLDE